MQKRREEEGEGERMGGEKCGSMVELVGGLAQLTWHAQG